MLYWWLRTGALPLGVWSPLLVVHTPPTRIQEFEFDELRRTFLDPADFVKMLAKRRVDFFTGVPDSLLKDFCAYVTDHVPASHHVITANEGAAVGFASGYQIASKRYPLVYLQNSGLGNIVNPLLSLADRKVRGTRRCVTRAGA